MFKKSTFFLVIFTMFYCKVNAQTLSKKQESEIRTTIHTQFEDASEEFQYNLGYTNVQFIGNDTL